MSKNKFESGQSAEDVLMVLYQKDLKRTGAMFFAKETILEAMHTYASKVCADKDREIDLLNESLIVMLRKNAELENQIESLRFSRTFISLPMPDANDENTKIVQVFSPKTKQP